MRPMTHGVRMMAGRDPHESHRAATPLELLYDLVFVISLGVAGSEFAHLVADGAISEGIVAFCFAIFAVIWAWIEFTWFASSYDTDDWQYRLSVMVQMCGVVILALGLPAMFDSVHHHEALDSTAMIFGYVIMRIPMVGLWLRAARQDPERAGNAFAHAIAISIAQVGWCLLLLVDFKIGPELLVAVPVFAIEFAGPTLSERWHGGTGSPWHPHHIAERYGLLTIITLGEVLIGTVAALNSVISLQGWTSEIAVFVVAGVGLTFGLWWTYFNQPAGELLEFRPEVAFLWGYGHLLLFGSITAVGAGLHVIALQLEHHTEISATVAMASAAIPVALYLVLSLALYAALIHSYVRYIPILFVKLAVVAVSMMMAAGGIKLGWCVLVLAMAPVVSVVYQELGGGKANDADLERVRRTTTG